MVDWLTLTSMEPKITQIRIICIVFYIHSTGMLHTLYQLNYSHLLKGLKCGYFPIRLLHSYQIQCNPSVNQMSVHQAIFPPAVAGLLQKWSFNQADILTSRKPSNCQFQLQYIIVLLLVLSIIFFHILQLVWVAQVNQLWAQQIDFCTDW